MRVYRGRAGTIEADREASDRVLESAERDQEPAVRVWRPHRQVAFGRRDARADGFERARETASEQGFPAVERSVGGRAVAYTGTTVAFARVTPIDDPREGLQERYGAATRALAVALSDLGVDARRGEPDDSFCPGTHSLQAAGKLVGIAQRVRKSVALVAGVLLVADHDEVAGVLSPVYDALGVSFDPDSVGSVARAGGDTDPETVVRAVEQALAGSEPTVERIG
jgi:octanoyl-[GcvH]:protein N-octanoyltransferase